MKQAQNLCIRFIKHILIFFQFEFLDIWLSGNLTNTKYVEKVPNGFKVSRFRKIMNKKLTSYIY